MPRVYSVEATGTVERVFPLSHHITRAVDDRSRMQIKVGYGIYEVYQRWKNDPDVPTPTTKTTHYVGINRNVLSRGGYTVKSFSTAQSARNFSISSILLFNTSENPYKEYSSINNLEGVGGTDRKKESSSLAAAPNSIIGGMLSLIILYIFPLVFIFCP